MERRLDDYAAIAGRSCIEELRLLARHLQGRRIVNVNSTAVGGGVAEILHRVLPLLKDLGLDARWEIIKGGEDFFHVTKKMHNALHGRREVLRARDFEVFLETARENAEAMALDEDIVFIHDPQPIPLIQRRRPGQRWFWRCHVDVSQPAVKVWSFLRSWIERYDAAVVSAPAFSQTLAIRQFLVSPSIDPLSDKNIPLPEDRVRAVLKKYDVDPRRPIVAQISRFDYLKDPVGVIQAYRIVKKRVDCQLVLAGGGADDDPEGAKVLAEVREAAGSDPDIHVLLLEHNNLEINALQRGADVIVQKSLREGFGLTVAEALFKGKPVVAGAVGGIPLQITHRHSGYLCHSIEGAAFGIKQFLNNPQYARRVGENGRRHVIRNFLLTRHLRDYLLLFLSLEHEGDIIRF